MTTVIQRRRKTFKSKIKRGKCHGSNEQILFARTACPSAPLGEPPPFDLETPWDDGFMLKPQVTLPNQISPFHRGVRMAQLQGDEDALALPVIVTQVPPRPQFPHRGLNYDYNPLPFISCICYVLTGRNKTKMLKTKYFAYIFLITT